jgi:hypothetical protein
MDRFEPTCSQAQRAAALAELRTELRHFSHDGLVQLAEDMEHRRVLRGTWSGCVISYRRGAPGSARRDRLGRARNAFTVLWDGGCLSGDEVAGQVRRELVRRRRAPARSEVDHAGCHG